VKGLRRRSNFQKKETKGPGSGRVFHSLYSRNKGSNDEAKLLNKGKRRGGVLEKMAREVKRLFIREGGHTIKSRRKKNSLIRDR